MEKSLLSVISVKQFSAKIHIWFTRKLTLKRNPINAQTVGKAFLLPYTLENV